MIVFILCVLLFLVGLYGVLIKRNLIKIIIGLAIMEYSVNLFLILVGYRDKGTSPIVTKGLENALFVDPLPQAMVLTAIVIGVATTALLLGIAVMIYKKYGTFNIRKINELKG
ncbi:MAG: NADH-quinone oxidoreductase subunit K [Spirochaetes bacterium]|nr:NADH-quinone oxidoreductase subunit K [Spirochaetota bacterium]